MTGLPDKIMKRIRAKGRGKWVCSPRDFLDLGSRAAVDKALSRLAKAGDLRRVAHGLYDLPRISGVLKRPVPVDLNLAVTAIARRDGLRILPDGMTAANQLGLTNAVPAKASFVIDGTNRTIKIGDRTVFLRQANRRVMSFANKPSASVVQALLWLGSQIAPDVQVTLKRILPDAVKKDLQKNASHLPGWAVPVVNAVAGAGP